MLPPLSFRLPTNLPAQDNSKRVGEPSSLLLAQSESFFKDHFSQAEVLKASIRFSAALNPIELAVKELIDKHAEVICNLAANWYEAQWNEYCHGGKTEVPNTNRTYGQVSVDAEIAHTNYFKNKEVYKQLKALREQRDQIKNRALQQQLDILFEKFAQGAGKSDRVSELEAIVVDKTSYLKAQVRQYPFKLDGNTVQRPVLEQALETQNDPKQAESVWRSLNGLGLLVNPATGQTVEQAFVELVKQRNQCAQAQVDLAGNPYPNFYVQKLLEAKLDPNQVRSLITQIEEVTRVPYQQYKEASNRLSQARYGVSPECAAFPWLGTNNLKQILGFDMNPYLRHRDIPALAEATAEKMGRSLKPVLEKSVYTQDGVKKSALYAAPGKPPIAFTDCIRAPEDVRLFGSIDPSGENMMDASLRMMLHEGIGHGLDRSEPGISKLPYLLRDTHSVTTESQAMLAESLMYEPDWMTTVLCLPADTVQAIAPKAKQYYLGEKLLKVRNMLCNADFEQQMYENPNQDLSKLWWKLQQKYLGVTPPPDSGFPGYLSVPHFINNPVYFPNYLLAELVRAQKQAYMVHSYRQVLSPASGRFLARVAQAGNTELWDKLVDRMTGKPLSVEAFAKEYADFKIPLPQAAAVA